MIKGLVHLKIRNNSLLKPSSMFMTVFIRRTQMEQLKNLFKLFHGVMVLNNGFNIFNLKANPYAIGVNASPVK